MPGLPAPSKGHVRDGSSSLGVWLWAALACHPWVCSQERPGPFPLESRPQHTENHGPRADEAEHTRACTSVCLPTVADLTGWRAPRRHGEAGIADVTTEECRTGLWSDLGVKLSVSSYTPKPWSSQAELQYKTSVCEDGCLPPPTAAPAPTPVVIMTVGQASWSPSTDEETEAQETKWLVKLPQQTAKGAVLSFAFICPSSRACAPTHPLPSLWLVTLRWWVLVTDGCGMDAESDLLTHPFLEMKGERRGGN